MTPEEAKKYDHRIPFTQYMRPDGRKRTMHGAVTEEVYGMAARLAQRGYRFEAEILRTGQVSLTITDGTEDVAIEVARNGPPVLEALDRLIRNFYAKTFRGAGHA